MKRSLSSSDRGRACRHSGGRSLRSRRLPTIQFDSNPMPLSMPDNIHLGEVAGVATNSRGDIYVYTRTGNPTITHRDITRRCARWDRACSSSIARASSCARSARASYGLLQAQQVRVDPQDNVWIVDQMSTQVIKFDPNGRSS